MPNERGGGQFNRAAMVNLIVPFPPGARISALRRSDGFALGSNLVQLPLGQSLLPTPLASLPPPPGAWIGCGLSTATA